MIGHFNTKQALLQFKNSLYALFLFLLLYNSAVRIPLIKHQGLLGFRLLLDTDQTSACRPRCSQNSRSQVSSEVHSLDIRSEVIANLFLGNRKTH